MSLISQYVSYFSDNSMITNPNINFLRIPANTTYFIEQEVIYTIPAPSIDNKFVVYYNLYNYGCTIDSPIYIKNLDKFDPTKIPKLVPFSYNQYMMATHGLTTKRISNSFIYTNSSTSEKIMYLFGSIYHNNSSQIANINDNNYSLLTNNFPNINLINNIKISGSLTANLLNDSSGTLLTSTINNTYLLLDTTNPYILPPYTISSTKEPNTTIQTQPPTIYYKQLASIIVDASSKALILQQIIFKNMIDINNNNFTLFYFCSKNSSFSGLYPPNSFDVNTGTYNTGTMLFNSYNVIGDQWDRYSSLQYENNNEYFSDNKLKFYNSYSSTFAYQNLTAGTETLYLYVQYTKLPTGFSINGKLGKTIISSTDNISSNLSLAPKNFSSISTTNENSYFFTTNNTNNNNNFITGFYNSNNSTTSKYVTIPAGKRYLINYNIVSTVNNDLFTTNLSTSNLSTLQQPLILKNVQLCTSNTRVFMTPIILNTFYGLTSNEPLVYIKKDQNMIENSIIDGSKYSNVVIDYGNDTLNSKVNNVYYYYNTSNDFGKNTSLTFYYNNTTTLPINLYLNFFNTKSVSSLIDNGDSINNNNKVDYRFTRHTPTYIYSLYTINLEKQSYRTISGTVGFDTSDWTGSGTTTILKGKSRDFTYSYNNPIPQNAIDKSIQFIAMSPNFWPTGTSGDNRWGSVKLDIGGVSSKTFVRDDAIAGRTLSYGPATTGIVDNTSITLTLTYTNANVSDARPTVKINSGSVSYSYKIL